MERAYALSLWLKYPLAIQLGDGVPVEVRACPTLTDDGKWLQSPDKRILDLLRRLWVVEWAECVLEELDLELGRVQGPELGL